MFGQKWSQQRNCCFSSLWFDSFFLNAINKNNKKKNIIQTKAVSLALRKYAKTENKTYQLPFWTYSDNKSPEVKEKRVNEDFFLKKDKKTDDGCLKEKGRVAFVYKSNEIQLPKLENETKNCLISPLFRRITITSSAIGLSESIFVWKLSHISERRFSGTMVRNEQFRLAKSF